MGCCGDNEVDTSGEPVKYDPTFKGPIENRSCTDVICCILFTVLFLGMIGVGCFAYSKGDPTKLLYPTDSEGNLCGVGEYADRPNLFFFDLLDCAKVGAAVAWMGCPTPQVCVSECPKKTFWWGGVIIGKFNPSELICKNGTDLDKLNGLNRKELEETVQELVEDEDCAAYYVPSDPIVGRCIPTFISEIIGGVGDLVTKENSTIVDKFGNIVNGTELEEGTKYLAYFLNVREYGAKIYADVRASWWMILVGLGLAMVIAFIWIILMRWIAGFMVWFTIIVFVGVFGFATYYTFNKYFTLKEIPESNGAFMFTTNLDYYWNLSNTWLAFGIISAVFLVVILLLVIFLRTRILIAIQLIKEASKAVGNMIFALFWPMIPFVLQVILFTFWGASALYLASMGSAQYSQADKTNSSVFVDGETEIKETIKNVTHTIPCNPNTNDTAGSVCNFLKYGGDEYTSYLQFYMLFMLFWTANFIVALGQMTLAGSFASYYWAFNKPNDIPAFPVSASLWRSLRYHLGTIAFGSLLVAIVQMIRVMLEYIDSKLKGSEYKIAKFFLKCLKCCFWCLEKFIKFVNKNAYILTAIYGYNFCKAAFQGFNLVLRNIVRVAVVDKVTDFIVFIGKLVIVAAITTLAYFFFSGDLAEQIPIETITDYIAAYTPKLNFYLVPVIIIGLGSYVIASGFFSVYSMGVDTLFLCFLEDLERNDGSTEKPYYMSKGLMKILGKKNDKPKEEGAKK